MGSGERRAADINNVRPLVRLGGYCEPKMLSRHLVDHVDLGGGERLRGGSGGPSCDHLAGHIRESRAENET